ASRRRMIRSLVPGRQSIPSRIPGVPVRRSNQVRSPLPTRRRENNMSTQPRQFAVVSRILHWLMAAMVLAMLGIGVGMVASLADYHVLVSIHRPLGIAILILVVVRFVNRQLTSMPPFPATMSPLERRAATASEYAMYVLMFVQPLVGWGMLSAARYPVVLYGSLHLPSILPHDAMLYAVLRKA